MENNNTMSVKERIVRISNEIKVDKYGWNTYSNYAYLTPEDIDNALKPLLLKYRLYLHFTLRKNQNGQNEAVMRVEDFDTDIGKQVYTMISEDISLKAANSVQAAAALRTFCYRYLKMTAFNISDNNLDFDAMKNGDSSGAKKSKNPDEELKDQLKELCNEKLKIGVPQDKILEILKVYDPKGEGRINNILTANVKVAIKKITSIDTENIDEVVKNLPKKGN